MESREWKRTAEDKKQIREKNEEYKKNTADEKLRDKALRYAKKINFAGVGNKAALADAVDQVESIMQKYKLDKLEIERVKMLSNGVMASANDSELNIGARLIRNPNAAYRICVDGYNKNIDENIKDISEKIALSKNSFEKEKLQQALDKLNYKKEFSRHNVIYKGDEVKSVIAHEMGHVLAGQLFGFIDGLFGTSNTPTNKKILDCFNESKKNGDIKKISAYAAKSADEFFAECFAVYTMGRETLPSNINNMMEGVLKIWKK